MYLHTRETRAEFILHCAHKTSFMKIVQFIRDAAITPFQLMLPFVLLSQAALAQRPTHIPPESPPVSFFDSISNIIFYIVIPVVILIVYLVWRNYTHKERQKKKDRLEQ